MRRAAALPAVLFTISLSSALAVSGVYVARRMAADASADVTAADLLSSSEQALADVIARWDSAARVDQPIAATVELGTSSATARSWLTRLGDSTYWLVAESARDVRPGARRRIGALLRLRGGLPSPVADRWWSELP